jgi:hypothetical protein
MTNLELSTELQTIDEEVCRILAAEHKASEELEHRWAADQAVLERLLRSIEEAELSGRWRSSSFNVFSVLGCARNEQAHSRLLAWLLDPAEAHGLGSKFLRGFMLAALGEEPPSTSDVRVSTEFHHSAGRFDIHIEGREWCLVVENKVDWVASEDQRNRYEGYCKSRRGKKARLVYVTPDTAAPFPDCHWISYGRVRDILESFEADPLAAPLIEHFCDHILSDFEVRL